MSKPLLLLLFLSSSLLTFGQRQILLVKRGQRTLERYWPGQVFSFAVAGMQWRKGELTRIQHDSFYIRPSVVHYYFGGSDTSYFPVEGYSIKDVQFLPRPRFLIAYNGKEFNFSRTGGHVHWYWVKSGWLFRAAGIGYAGLYLTNGLIRDDLDLKDGRLAIAGGSYLLGFVLKRVYRIYRPLNKRLHLQNIAIE